MNGTIYKIENKINGKVYIGQTWHYKSRYLHYKNLHCKRQPKLYRALKKYGIDNFTFEALAENIIDQKELDSLECYWMEKFDCRTKGYNIKEGGSAGRHAEETKKKISLASKGRPKSEEHKKNMSLALKGENHPMYGKKGKNNPNYDKKHSEESKMKMSLTRTGKKHSEESKMKMSQAQYLRWAKQKKAAK
jgi:group I intron endonuclease